MLCCCARTEWDRNHIIPRKEKTHYLNDIRSTRNLQASYPRIIGWHRSRVSCRRWPRQNASCTVSIKNRTKEIEYFCKCKSTFLMMSRFLLATRISEWLRSNARNSLTSPFLSMKYGGLPPDISDQRAMTNTWYKKNKKGQDYTQRVFRGLFI